MKQLTLALILLLVAMAAPAAKMYKWVDDKGRVHYSETQPAEGKIVTKSQSESAGPQDPKYCEELRSFAQAVAEAMRRGAPIESVISTARGIEQTGANGAPLEEPVLRQVTYYVYGFVHGSATPYEIAGLAHGQCMSGGYSPTRKPQKQTPSPARQNAAPESVSMGTGWVAPGGYIVTNNHVVHGHSNVKVIRTDGEELSASVYVRDDKNDVALLRVYGDKLPPALPLAHAEAAIGSEVFTIGYPHTDIMGQKPKLSSGIINAQTGLQDDARAYQISVPLQAGNSGGPLLNKKGEVVGIVTSKLSASVIFEWTGDLPQNVNYAVKSAYVSALLSNAPDNIAGGQEHPRQAGSLEELSVRVQDSIVRVVAN